MWEKTSKEIEEKEKLLRRIARLERMTEYRIPKYGERSQLIETMAKHSDDYMRWTGYKYLSIEEVINLILKHLNITIEYQPGTPESVTTKKCKTK
jgi:hypothetical protein